MVLKLKRPEQFSSIISSKDIHCTWSYMDLHRGLSKQLITIACTHLICHCLILNQMTFQSLLWELCRDWVLHQSSEACPSCVFPWWFLPTAKILHLKVDRVSLWTVVHIESPTHLLERYSHVILQEKSAVTYCTRNTLTTWKYGHEVQLIWYSRRIITMGAWTNLVSIPLSRNSV